MNGPSSVLCGRWFSAVVQRSAATRPHGPLVVVRTGAPKHGLKPQLPMRGSKPYCRSVAPIL